MPCRKGQGWFPADSRSWREDDQGMQVGHRAVRRPQLRNENRGFAPQEVKISKVPVVQVLCSTTQQGPPWLFGDLSFPKSKGLQEQSQLLISAALPHHALPIARPLDAAGLWAIGNKDPFIVGLVIFYSLWLHASQANFKDTHFIREWSAGQLPSVYGNKELHVLYTRVQVCFFSTDAGK